MKIRRGLNGGRYKPLNDKDVEKIHQTSLKIFSEVGVQVNFPEALELFKKAGATINESSKIAKFNPELVMELIKPAPSVVRLCGRDDSGELDCEIGGNKVYMGTGGTALNVQDPGERSARRSKLEDIKNMARLVDKGLEM
jgi:trimethylamine--corrinoid protein Co-methyltransferase